MFAAFSSKAAALKNLARIQNDPIFNAETQAEAAKLTGWVKTKQTHADGPHVIEFFEKCRAQAENDIFNAPLSSLTWVTEGKWSPTAASYASTWGTMYVDPFTAGCLGAISAKDSARLLLVLRQ